MVEGDEYDCAFFDKRPKFVHYLPDVAVIGNVEYDHADIYPDLPAVETAFRRLLSVLPRRGRLIAGIESPAVRAARCRDAPCPVETFGLGGGRDLVRGGRAAGRGRHHVPSAADRAGPGRVHVTDSAGDHNVRNAWPRLAAAAAVGVPPEAAREALAAFGGVKRRLELRGRARGVAVYDDFAHHPTAVKATLRRAPRQAAGPDA